MGALLKLVGLWGAADAVWLAVDPSSWARFWGRWVGVIGRGGVLARVVAAAELAISLYLVLRERGRQAED